MVMPCRGPLTLSASRRVRPLRRSGGARAGTPGEHSRSAHLRGHSRRAYPRLHSWKATPRLSPGTGAKIKRGFADLFSKIHSGFARCPPLRAVVLIDPGKAVPEWIERELQREVPGRV